MSEIRLPEPHPKQLASLDAAVRFKVCRRGRQNGKTLEGVIAAIAGHGPGWREGTPQFPGVSQGKHILWLAPDFTQGQAVWLREIKPRCAGIPGIHVSEQDKMVTFPNGGTFKMFSAENVDGIRGQGVHGMVVDEAAHQDLGYSWPNVLRPALAVRAGWAYWLSTPWAGLDGNKEGLTPSYFNRVCARIQAREQGPDWAEFHARTRDNPYISAAEIATMYAEYPKDSPVSQQELDALLLTAGSGLAFPQFQPACHVVRWPEAQTRGWRWYGGLDWGYRTSGCFVLFGVGPDGDHTVRWDWPFRELEALSAGRELGERLMGKGLPVPQIIGCDSAMTAVTDGGPTVLELFQSGLKESLGKQTPPCVPSPKGRGSIAAGTQMLHGLLRWPEEKEPADLKPWERPRLTFHPEALYLLRTIQVIAIDPKDPEAYDSNGEDHGLDALRYGLMMRPQGSEAPERQPDPDRVFVTPQGSRIRWDQPDPTPTKHFWSRPRKGTRQEVA